VAVPGEAAPAHLARDTGTEPRDGGGADTILTEEFESPGASREAVAPGPVNVTSGHDGARRAGARATVNSEAAETLLDVAAGVSVKAAEPRRSLAPLVAGGALALLLVAGVGGWLAWRGWGAKPEPSSAPQTPQPARAAAVPKAEAASYWFESFEKEKDSAGRRVAELAPTLASDTWLKIHFVARRRGYLYIIGPGKDGNARMTFLTAKGARALKSNYVGAGADFSLPFGDKRIWVDTNPGADEFNFIFSPTPLMSPSFLAGENEHELTPAEIAEWEQFRARFEQEKPELAARGEGGERQVVVLAPEPATEAGGPLIFDVRIDHR
jgi:hypothetical protein